MRSFKVELVLKLYSKKLITPVKPLNEIQRLDSIQDYNLLDTLPEDDYDNITNLAASICEVPISLVTVLDTDRNFFKSHYGIPFSESPRDISFCGHAILDEGEIFIVEDARKDLRFMENPIVADLQAIFYAGVRLVNKEGYPLGTLCVFDKEPRKLTNGQKKALIALGKQVVNLFEARKNNITLREIQSELEERNRELKNFAGIVSHDMKMPLANIILTADMLKKKYGEQMDKQGLTYLDYLKQSSFNLSDYIGGLLLNYSSDQTAALSCELFDIQQLLEQVVDLLNIQYDCEIEFPENNIELYCNRIALEQILLNLIGNSLKYNYKERVLVKIECSEEDKQYRLKVIDNGMGIPTEKLENIFELFSTTGIVDRNGNKGNGIGLSTVQKLVTRLGGSISVTSKVKEGTTFEFTIAKQ